MRSPGELAIIAAIADDLPCGVWVAAAPDGRFVYSNRAFDEIMGMGPVPEVGVGQYTGPYGIYGRDGEPYPEHRLPFVRALEERATVVVDDLVIHRRDGRRVFVRAFGKPMFEADTITHVAIAFFDITREAEAQAQLARAERLASLGMLAAGVAHEVNNPLSFVLGNIELLEHDVARAREAVAGLPGSVDERLRDARAGVERVRAIVRELKVFSRVDDRPPRPCDVRVAVEAAASMAHNEIRHRARLLLDLAPLPNVIGDEGRLAQVFLNLLVNAAHAIPEGDAAGHEIRVTARPAPEGVRVEVSDTGAGIAPDVLPRIFDPFFTTKTVGAGTGLGLAICQAVVTALGGRIEVDSEIGRGTSVRVFLPAASSDLEPVLAPPQVPTKPGRRGAVLLVDDEPLLVKVLSAMLAQEHDVTRESSAGEALARIRRGERFDAIVCDLMMPQMTGMDLYDALIEIAPDQARAMIFLTGGAFTPRARAFLERFPDATLDKPVEWRTLQMRVRRIVG